MRNGRGIKRETEVNRVDGKGDVDKAGRVCRRCRG